MKILYIISNIWVSNLNIFFVMHLVNDHFYK